MLQHPPFPRRRRGAFPMAVPLHAAAHMHPFACGSGLVHPVHLRDPDFGNANKLTSPCFVSKTGALPRCRCCHVAGLPSPPALMPKSHGMAWPGSAWHSTDFLKQQKKVGMPGGLLATEARWKSLVRARLVRCWSAFKWGGVHVGGASGTPPQALNSCDVHQCKT